MKQRKGLVVSVLSIVIMVMLFINLRSCDTVTEKYDTYAEAKAGGIFNRGWLPEVVPASATKLIATNNLDTNTSEGEFYFSSDDAPLFISSLQLYEAPVAELLTKEVELKPKGYGSYEYVQGSSRWVFFVQGRIGHVIYFLIPQ
jgi:hypothetical protein